MLAVCLGGVLIIILAAFMGWCCHKLQLPPLLGYLLTGFCLGPSIPVHLGIDLTPWSACLFIQQQHLDLSPYVRSAALMIILFRAGLQLKWEDLKICGRPAFFLSFLPLCFEALAIYHFSMLLLGLSATEASLLSFCIAAVSPAVIVPSMLHLIRSGENIAKNIPVMILAGSSLDDVLALAGFSAMLALAQNIDGWGNITSVPVALFIGLLTGGCLGYLFSRASSKLTSPIAATLLCLTCCIFLTLLEQSTLLPFSAVLAIMTFGFTISRYRHDLAHEMGHILKYLWQPAECLLFVMVGAEVAPQYLIQAGWLGILLIILGLIARSMGVGCSLLKCNFEVKEKLFCVLAYLPKATVQAAIGGVALQYVLQDKLTLPHGQWAGEMILAVSVMSIALTAPLGAIAIHKAIPLILKAERQT